MCLCVCVLKESMSFIIRYRARRTGNKSPKDLNTPMAFRGRVFVVNFFFFGLFGATPAACGSSQARGLTGATATSRSHSNAGSEPRL